MTKGKRRISEAEQYLLGVQSGEIVACKRIKQLAEMMLPRFEGGYKRWRFDYEKANRPVEFIERFCKLPSGKIGTPLTLEPFQAAVIQLAFGFVDDDGLRQFQEVFWMEGRKNAKALSLSTPIPTPDGWKQMGDIHPGNCVFDKNGKPVEVLYESEIFDKPMYRMYFEDGATINASADHLWTVQTKHSRRQAKKGKCGTYRGHAIDNDGWFTITTEEMASCGISYRRADGKGVEYEYRVPMCSPIEYDEADLPIDPYLLGVWLGDGTSDDNTITVGEADLDEMLMHLRNFNPKVRRFRSASAPKIRVGNTSFVRGDNRAPRRHNDVKDALRELDLLKNKHIPEQYLTASIEQRWELLKGLMDTDGTCSKKGQCSFVQKSRAMTMQFAQLCASLGIKTTVRGKRVKCNGKDAGIAYSATFFVDKSHTCFKLARKTERLKDHLAPRMGAKSIVRIERIANEPSKCIAVDSPHHVYLAGRRYTATHNTTTSSAIELYMLLADGEGSPAIFNVATSKDQASLAYGAVWKMVKQSPELLKAVRKGTVVDRHQDGLICDRTMGYITPLTSQTRHLDGLDVHMCVFDEMAASTNRDQYDLMKQGMSARKQPLLWAITTNGFERENLFDTQYEYACGILDGGIEDDRMLPVLYELDDRAEWTDEGCWVKANPGLGTIKSWDYMRDTVNKAMQDPSFLPTVMTKEFNMPESRASAWLTFEEAVNEEPLPFPIAENPSMPNGEGFRYGIAGFDASDTTDLSAAKMLMMRPDDPRIYELSMYWLPEDALNKDSGYRRERDDVPYRLWEERGLLRTVPGNTVPKRVFLDWLEEVKQNYDVYTFAIGYDPWHVIGTDEEALQQYVGKDRCVQVRQGPKTLSQPMKQFRAQLEGNLVVGGHNPIDEWCRMNVSVKTDVNANIQPVKMQGKAKNRIDGFMAELCAYIAYLMFKDEYEGVI